MRRGDGEGMFGKVVPDAHIDRGRLLMRSERTLPDADLPIHEGYG
jgi:hypothetical protein